MAPHLPSLKGKGVPVYEMKPYRVVEEQLQLLILQTPALDVAGSPDI